MAGERLVALISWSGGDWVGVVPSLPRCEARAKTRHACLDSLVTRAATLLQVPLTPLIVEEETPALVGISEAAALLGWDRRKFATYVARGHLPHPVAELAGGRVWRRADIEAYAQERQKGMAG